MNKLKRLVLGTLTIKDLVTYFHEIGIKFDITFQKKPQIRYYAKNSRLYKVKK